MAERLEMPVIVGNPFFSTGRGSTAISFLRAFKAARWVLPLKDIYSYAGHRSMAAISDANLITEIESSLVDRLSKSINIYHVNVNEIEHTISVQNNSLPDGAYNIIYPFWELSKIPDDWIDKFKLFDEIWAPSNFILTSLKKQVAMPIYHMPLPVEIKLDSFVGRQYFDLPESSFIFLLFFDFRSYIDRKNPQALIEVFEKVCVSRPSSDIRVVIKVHGEDYSPKARQDFQDLVNRIQASRYKDKIIIINKLLSDNEIKNLVRCSDCFISLHRSEGFGLGMAEAMYLGKSVIATAYSGNMDFMNDEIALLVDFDLIPVQQGQYPHHEGNFWAEPDKEQAAHHMITLIDNPARSRQIGRQASQHIRTHFSYLALGLKYKQRLEQIYHRSLPRYSGEHALTSSEKREGKWNQKVQVDPIIVYQMGKVGSTTVQQSLIAHFKSNGLNVPVHHIHNLNNLEIMERDFSKRAENGQNVESTLMGIRLGLALKKQMDQNPNQRWNLISLVRDPIARNVSEFFHALPEFVPNWKQLHRDGNLSIHELHEIFITKFEHHVTPEEWFDTQMKTVFGIDVYKEPFPKSVGYNIYPPQSNARLLLIRLEDLDRCAQIAMLEFLGLSKFSMINVNVAEDKGYIELYKAFRRTSLPMDYIEMMYTTKYSRHFYTPSELEAFIQRWTQSI